MMKKSRNISNKDIVLQNALTLFLTKGFHDTSMDEIVTVSKVSKTNIYYHFKSKEELLIAIVDRLIARYEQQFSYILAQDEMSVMNRLERIFQILMEDNEQTDVLGGCPFLTLYMQTSQASTEVRAKIKGFFDTQLLATEKLLEIGIMKKELRQDLPVQQTAAWIVTSIEGALFIAKACNNPKVLQDLVQGLASILK